MTQLQHISEILHPGALSALMESQEPAPDISSRTRSNGELVTLEQVIAEQIPHHDPPEPTSAICEFCGAKLWRRAIVLNFGTIYRTGAWFEIERCICPDARAHWNKIDMEQLLARKQAEEAERNAKELQRIQRLTGQSGMGRRFLERRFDTFRVDDGNRKAHAACLKYVDTFAERRRKGEGLYLSGPYGTGKTHLAAAIANALLERGTPVMLLTMQRILDCIKDSYDDDGELSTHEVLEQFRSCTLLIIDDLGKELPTGWAQSELYRIINDRYEAMAPVIVTTNYRDDDLANRLSSGRGCDPVTAEAIVSRLHEMTYAVPVAGVDRRLAGGQS